MPPAVTCLVTRRVGGGRGGGRVSLALRQEGTLHGGGHKLTLDTLVATFGCHQKQVAANACRAYFGEAGGGAPTREAQYAAPGTAIPGFKRYVLNGHHAGTLTSSKASKPRP